MRLKNWPCGFGTIFMLHRISHYENGKLLANENMKVTPDFLEHFIISARKRNFEFISIDELVEIFFKNKKNTSKKIVLTLDDGYLDNLTFGLPLFKKHNIPFTVYVTTSFPDRTAILWWYPLENLIVNNDHICLKDNSTYTCQSFEEKNYVFNEIRNKILQIPPLRLLENLNWLFEDYQVDWFSVSDELCMDWNQIEQLSREPLVTIGAHTVNHYKLSDLSNTELTNEVVKSKRILEEHLQKEIRHFSYPFGSRDECFTREFLTVKDAGFTTATTTRAGNLFFDHKNHLEALPRIMLKNNFTWSNYYLFLIKRFLRGRMVTK